MRKFLLIIGACMCCTSCAALPQLASSMEAIATDDAIKISVDKDAFQKSTDVKVTVEVINKDRDKE